MKNFFLFNFVGIALMVLGVYAVLHSIDVGVFYLVVGLCSVVIGYREGFKAQR